MIVNNQLRRRHRPWKQKAWYSSLLEISRSLMLRDSKPKPLPTLRKNRKSTWIPSVTVQTSKREIPISNSAGHIINQGRSGSDMECHLNTGTSVLHQLLLILYIYYCIYQIPCSIRVEINSQNDTRRYSEEGYYGRLLPSVSPQDFQAIRVIIDWQCKQVFC